MVCNESTLALCASLIKKEMTWVNVQGSTFSLGQGESIDSMLTVCSVTKRLS